MTKMLKILKNYPLSAILIAVIWILCFMDVPETPLSNISLIDKWTHIAMYAGTCSVMWIEFLRKRKKKARNENIARTPADVRNTEFKNATLIAFVSLYLAPILMSGIIEILQATCTGGRRSGEWLDFFANSIGCTLPFIVGILYLLRKK